MSKTGDEDEEARLRKRAEDRRALLEGRIEDGGEYRSPRRPLWVEDAGCCLLQAAGTIGMIAALALPAWRLLS